MSGKKADNKRKKPPFDIREYKKSLRNRYKKVRQEMTGESRVRKDAKIFEYIKNSKFYKDAEIILCYVSLKDEVNTHNFINKAISDGKTVGVPYCIEGTRDMEFYRIKSLDELEKRTYGVLEPVAEKAELITDYRNSLCILPGLSFDKFGYRLGYGGGYYDRFLSSKFSGNFKIGVCYQRAVTYRLIHGYYDIPCDYIITENGIRKSWKNKDKDKKKKR